MNDTIIELKHLKKYYGKTTGIEDVTLTIKKGEIYGFIGPNGAGKSTTIKTILGLINKTSGDIYFKGKEMNTDDLNTKKVIGYLPSEINLYDDMTVGQIFDYHQTFYEHNCSKRKKELVKLLKIDEHKKIEDLSLGNLKKVGIVLALMHEPELLVLDEPTLGLDPMMQSVFHDILVAEKAKGTTIIYSSHVLSEVSSICDRVGLIKDGVIIKEDYMENIIKNNYTYLTISSKNINNIKKSLNLDIVKESNGEVTFINNLPANELIKKLAKYDINRLLVQEISLEDLFINYYK